MTNSTSRESPQGKRSVHSEVDNIVPSRLEIATRRLFELTNQTDYVGFEDVFEEEECKTLHFLGCGAYGFVLGTAATKRAFKFLLIEADPSETEASYEKLNDAINELVVTKSLSSLGDDISEQHFSKTFGRLFAAYFVRARTPQCVVEACRIASGDVMDKYPSIKDPSKVSLWVVMEMELYGASLGSIDFLCDQSRLSVFLQIAMASAVAEAKFQFEHRDLHIGNILLIGPLDDKVCSQRRRSQHSHLGDLTLKPPPGPLIKIIDFTCSRITLEKSHYYFDFELCQMDTKSTDSVYHKMRQNVGTDWSKYEPRNNILWLELLAKHLLWKPDVEGSAKQREGASSEPSFHRHYTAADKEKIRTKLRCSLERCDSAIAFVNALRLCMPEFFASTFAAPLSNHS